MDLNGTTLHLPDPSAPATTVAVELGQILECERRQEEIAYVTSTKAPELLRAFSVAWREGHKRMLLASTMLLLAQKKAAERRARVTLDVAPELLKTRGLSSNDENRKAVVELDVEFQACQDVADQWATAVEFLKGKLRTLERDHSAVKAIVKDGAYNGAVRGGSNPNLSGGVSQDSSPIGGLVAAAAPHPAVQETKVRATGFGKAVY